MLSNKAGRTHAGNRCLALCVVAIATGLPAAVETRLTFAEPPGSASNTTGKPRLEDLNIRHRTEHYTISATDTVPQTELEEYGRALEYVHREYLQGFGKLLNSGKNAAGAARGKKNERAEPRADRKTGGRRDTKTGSGRAKKEGPDGDAERFRVIVFSNDKEYQAFGREFLSGSTEHTNGMFIPQLKLLLIQGEKHSEDTYSVLFHESFHQFIDRYIKDPPVWLNEGLATYYGTAQPTPSGLGWTKTPRFGWAFCRQALQFNKAIPLREVVYADRMAFYDTTAVDLPRYDKVIRRHFFYAESYTLIHMLIKDKTGLARLQNYIRDLAKDDGTNTAKITNKYFDPATCDRLSAAWAKYVNDRSSARVPRR